MAAGTYRILKAFAWLRWRVLMNSLERTGARDTLERLSIALEQIGPLIAIVTIGPSAIVLAGFGGYAGYWLAREDIALSFEALSMLLFAASGLALVGPLFMPSIERTNTIRLLLLPIPRRTLYLTQAASAISEPWVLLPAPALLGIAVGLAAGGALFAAAIAVVAGLLLIAVFVNLSVLSALVLNLIVRNRRRGELLALLVIIIGPMIGLLPTLLHGRHRSHDRSPAAQEAAQEQDQRVEQEPAASRSGQSAVLYVMSLLPADQYARATRAAAGRVASWSPWTNTSQGGIAVPLLMLTGYVVVLHGLGRLAFGRLLDAPSSGSKPRTARSSGASSWSAALPGLSKPAAAVAQSQLRLAIRTPRGRSMLISPVIVFGMFVVMALRNHPDIDIGFLQRSTGLALATLGSAVCLLALLPFAMNQFAVDRAGLTMLLLLPIDTAEILAGKAVGNGLIGAAPALLVTVLAFIFFPQGDWRLWVSLPLALIATYLLLAPAAAALSAIFPRAVDLNSIGRGSNAHGLATALGILIVAGSALPSGLLIFGVTGLLHRPGLTVVLLVLWCGLAAVISRVLFTVVRAVFERRRENLGLVVRPKS